MRSSKWIVKAFKFYFKIRRKKIYIKLDKLHFSLVYIDQSGCYLAYVLHKLTRYADMLLVVFINSYFFHVARKFFISLLRFFFLIFFCFSLLFISNGFEFIHKERYYINQLFFASIYVLRLSCSVGKK